ncbi:hypothetical protein ACFFRR_002626 [Megaselia abdita]
MIIKILFLIIFPAYANVISKDRVETQSDCALTESLKEEIQKYQPVVDRIAHEILNGKFKGETYNSLLDFTDKFGARMVGSTNLENAIDFMLEEFKKQGLENVHGEKAEVTHWIRGVERASVLSPYEGNLPILGLGTSVGTPKKGLKAGVVVVESFDELKALPDSEVDGKIVVFVPKWESYGKTVIYRARGAVEAAKKGAVASLIRSITPFSIGSLHTGMQVYDDDVPKIPTASITVEDASRLLRLYRKNETITIKIRMDDYDAGKTTSRNTIGELVGSVYKNTSVVVVSGHLDSWDVGVGAMDDGGGSWISWKAVQYLKAMDLRPKRTIRAILWTGEEFGLLGAKAYETAHKSHEQEEFNFFIESDAGTFEPRGLDFTGNKEAECIFKEVLKLMTPINATEFDSPADGGPDVSWWMKRGFPGASLLNKGEKYFWYHHSAGDSMLVEDTVDLDRGTALFAAAAYVIADLSVDIPKTVTNLGN